MISDVLRCFHMFSRCSHMFSSCSQMFSRCSQDILWNFSRCSLELCKVISRCSQGKKMFSWAVCRQLQTICRGCRVIIGKGNAPPSQILNFWICLRFTWISLYFYTDLFFFFQHLLPNYIQWTNWWVFKQIHRNCVLEYIFALLLHTPWHRPLLAQPGPRREAIHCASLLIAVNQSLARENKMIGLGSDKIDPKVLLLFLKLKH